MSVVVIPLIGLVSKACLGVNTVSITGIDILHRALREENRRGRGVLTISNHISVLDDPLMWGCLPTFQYFERRNMRWTLGASDIMFTNPLFSAFFRAGQVIETFRGKGVHQPAIDDAIRKLNAGGWIHMFPEGKVNQHTTNPAGGLFRFKWGIGRILMDTLSLPTIIPMWLEGFDALMPESRAFPRFIPRLGPSKKISITFGEPLSPEAPLAALLDARRQRQQNPLLRRLEFGAPELSLSLPGSDIESAKAEEQKIREVGVQHSAPSSAFQCTAGLDLQSDLHLRTDVTRWLQNALDDLGRRISEQNANGM